MRIRFVTSIAGTNFSHKPGDVVDWPRDAEAERFIAAGYAVPADERRRDRPAMETAERRPAAVSADADPPAEDGDAAPGDVEAMSGHANGKKNGKKNGK